MCVSTIILSGSNLYSIESPGLIKKITSWLKQKGQTLIRDFEQQSKYFEQLYTNEYLAQSETLYHYWKSKDENWKSGWQTNTKSYGQSLLNSHNNVWPTTNTQK